MVAYWPGLRDEGIQKKDETVDRVGGRIWTTKSDLLSRKIVRGVIKGC